MDYMIRPAGPEDAAGITALRRMPGVFENTLGLPSERVQHSIDGCQRFGPDDHIFVAVLEDGTVIGSAGLQVCTNPRMRHVGNVGLYVHADYQNQGVGTALMKAMLELADNWLMLVRVELEVFDFDMDKAALIGPAPYAAKFAADMRTTHSNFGLLVDLSHFPTTYETSQFVIRTLRPYITHFHFGNAVVKEGCDGYGDLHPRFGYPNSANDTAELLDFFRVLKQEGFFNAENPYVLSMEVTLRPGEDEAVVLANTKRVVNRAWALLED